MFKRYPKIHRLGKEETEGILEGICHIEEKIDGANASIWVDEGKVQVGSRNQMISNDVDSHKEQGTFNGLVDYIRNHEGIRRLLSDHPDYRLYGEWLVRHTIGYNESSYKQFYLFDITNKTDEEGEEEFFKRKAVSDIATVYNIKTPTYHGSIENPSEAEIQVYVGKSTLGEKGEGVVIKNELFRDKFGSHNYAKIVTESFKEDNGVTFGGNNKHSDSYWEMHVCNKYMTLARVEKIMNKIQPTIDKKLDLEHIPRISGTAYHDMLTEEIWEIQGKVQALHFGTLKRIATKKATAIYKEILSGDISVAHAKTTTTNLEGVASVGEEHSSEGAAQVQTLEEGQ